jgi:thiol-disulfide isomerase/thioredoxin
MSSCKDEPSLPIDDLDIPAPDKEEIQKDSITINVLAPAGGSTGLNMVDKYSKHLYLSFKNKSDKDSIISKTILRPHALTRFEHGIRMFGSKWDSPTLKLLVTDTLNTIDLVDIDNSLQLEDAESLIDITTMTDTYDSLRVLIHKWKKDDSKFYSLLDSIYESYKFQYNEARYKNSGDYSIADEVPFEGHRLMNKYSYYATLQNIDPYDPRVEELILNEDLYIPRSPSSGMLFLYLKERLLSIPFDSLNSTKYTDAYRKNLSYGLVNLLSSKEYKKADRYLSAKKWLRTTDYYNSDPETIESMITPLSSKKFTALLSNLDFITADEDSLSIKQVLAKAPNNYYMIDLWATWCAPCLSNMKLLEEMELPSSLEIINVSSDYEKDAEAWRSMHSEIMQDKLSYRLNVDAKESKAFLEFIQLKSIPRYILFDKNLNLIDHNFYAPYEPQFQNKIYDLSQYKYW